METRHGRRPGRLLVTGLLVTALLAAAGCTTGSSNLSAKSAGRVSTSPVAMAGRPNIVFVLTDDLSSSLVRFMPHVRAMKQQGTSFTNYTVTDSLCCPSRSSIFTGNYPHNTQVYTNNPPWGGYQVFHAQGDDRTTFATVLHDHGYRTGFMGKYLNGWHAGSPTRAASPTPPGWDDWDAVGWGYREFGYYMAHGSSWKYYGHRPQDYLTTVLQRRAKAFIGSAANSGQPFFLEVSTFTPHTPYVPAPRDAGAFRGLRAPRTAAFDRLPTHAPAWLAGRHRLRKAQIGSIDGRFRLRARDVLSIDRMLGAIERSLARAGVAQNTIVVFSSDNGYHLGQYRLEAGKMTAFDTDVKVPLVVTGPQVRAGATNADSVQNIDLAPTFEELAGVQPSAEMDGVSVVDLLRGRVSGWNNAALVEHHGPDRNTSDPDFQGKNDANPPSYQALRTTRYTYVEYADGSTELYDRRTDPAELHNIAGELSAQRRAQLHDELLQLSQCHGAAQCTAARNAQ